MSKKKKQNLDEGMIMLSPMLPVGGVHGLGGMRTKEDNFVFKGLPGQFDEDGNKILDEHGNSIVTELGKKTNDGYRTIELTDTKTGKKAKLQVNESGDGEDIDEIILTTFKGKEIVVQNAGMIQGDAKAISEFVHQLVWSYAAGNGIKAK